MEELKAFFKKYRCFAAVFLVLVNILWFMYMEFTGATADNEGMISCGAMVSDALEKGNYIQLLTSFFVHFDMQHLCNNMLLLIAIGAMLEKHMGTVRFTIIYMLSGLGGNIVSAISHVNQGNVVVSAGASGAVFGIVGGLLAALILNKGRIEDMTSRKIIIFAGLSLYQGFASQGIDNAAHVGGFVCGIIISAICELTRKDRYKHEG